MAESDKSLKELEDYCSKMVEKFPKSADAWYCKGSSILCLGKPKEAIDCYDKALKFNPELLEAQLEKGVALLGLSKFDDAIETLKAVVAKNEKDAAPLFFLAFTYALKKEEKNMRFFLIKAIDIDSEAVVFLYDNMMKGILSKSDAPNEKVMEFYELIADLKKKMLKLKSKKGKK
jgi:tetratricopeptide (TPR) repeat protein